MTREEIKLWVQLKHFNARGYHFRRQAQSNGFILHFAEFNCKLIIEVDGFIDHILSALPATPAALRATFPKGEETSAQKHDPSH